MNEQLRLWVDFRRMVFLKIPEHSSQFDIYGHLFPQAKQEASSRLEETMFAKRKEPLVEDLVEKPPKQGPARREGRRANVKVRKGGTSFGCGGWI